MFQVLARGGVVLMLSWIAAGCSEIPTTPTPVARSIPVTDSPPPRDASTPVRRQLPIAGLFQQTAEWCWAAVAEMVLGYYQEPNVNPVGNFQCGLVGAAGAMGLFPTACQFNCGSCVLPIGDSARFAAFLRQYPTLVRTATGATARDLSVTRGGALSFNQVRTTLDGGAPIVAGITPNNIPSPLGPAHASLIVGYDTTVPGGQGVIVNDPYPFGIGPFGQYGDPYLQRRALSVSRGQYLIDYSAFADGLAWTDSILVR